MATSGYENAPTRKQAPGSQSSLDPLAYLMRAVTAVCGAYCHATRPERSIASGVLFPRKARERVMYPWPIGNFDYGMDDALDIALNYLTLTGQAVMFQEVRSTAATAIAAAWRGGVRHRIRLATARPSHSGS